MTRIRMHALRLAVVLGLITTAQADPVWFTISFTGTEMYNYTTGVAPRADQEAPRRFRETGNPAGNNTYESYEDLNPVNGENDFADWAAVSQSGFGYSYFNLYGGTLAGAGSWDQKYRAVPDNGDGSGGVNSWRNIRVNGTDVLPGMGSPFGWSGGVVRANEPYNMTDYAFPVWRAPTGTQLTMANAASLRFSADVLMENFATAFEPDGRLRVWFGGFDVPQGTGGHAREIGGIMTITPVPEPFTMALMGASAIVGFARVRRRKR